MPLFRSALGKTFPAKHVVSCVEQSLRSLGVEALQIEQLDVWHDAWLEASEWPELRGAMQRLKEQGKVLHWGVSVNDHAHRTALKLVEVTRAINPPTRPPPAPRNPCRSRCEPLCA